ncbi:hypothetical protein ACFX2I_008908 [Malus domestica]
MDCLTGQISFSLSRILHQNAASPKTATARWLHSETAATNLSCGLHRHKPMVQAGHSSMACMFIDFAQTSAFALRRCHLLSHARYCSPLQALRMAQQNAQNGTHEVKVLILQGLKIRLR